MTKEEMTDYLREIKFKESIGGSMCDSSQNFVTNILKVRGVPKVYIHHLRNSLSKKLYSYCDQFKIAGVGFSVFSAGVRSGIKILVYRYVSTREYVIPIIAIFDPVSNEVISIEDEFGFVRNTMEDRFLELLQLRIY